MKLMRGVTGSRSTNPRQNSGAEETYHDGPDPRRPGTGEFNEWDGFDKFYDTISRMSCIIPRPVCKLNKFDGVCKLHSLYECKTTNCLL